MSTNFWELLQQHQNDLTKSGHMVADYLVQHAAEAQYLSISSWQGNARWQRLRCSGSAGRWGLKATMKCALHWHRPMLPAHWSTSVRRSRTRHGHPV